MMVGEAEVCAVMFEQNFHANDFFTWTRLMLNQCGYFIVNIGCQEVYPILLLGFIIIHLMQIIGALCNTLFNLLTILRAPIRILASF